MRKTKVRLSDDLADFVAERIRAGGYTNQSEVVREGLRLLRARDRNREVLTAALDRGHAENVAGKRRSLTDDALRDITERGRRLAEERTARTR
ncbi:MAG: type II toxin-antitoxin system ParD family antitoxin [Candidatus Eremiobacteraeota bacterium]|nr:type II toxin-antitoxin system ParD family antitoxin [Candidatus Eremiobacteraeota bacterium]